MAKGQDILINVLAKSGENALSLKYIKRLVFSALLFFFILMLIPCGKLIFTDVKVARLSLFDTYLVKISSNQNEMDVFTKYMKDEGWIKKDQLGGIFIFEKKGFKKQISNTQVKTFLVNGKLNIDN